MPTLSELLPAPGIWGQENHWPTSVGNPSFGRNDITTLLEDTGVLEGQKGPGDDVGPVSVNVEDRRGQPYVPMSMLEKIAADFRGGHFAYPGRKYGPYDADIDAALQRAEAMNAATPAIAGLANMENWFRALDRPAEPGPEPPENVRRAYQSLKGSRQSKLPEGLSEEDIRQALTGPGWEKIQHAPESTRLQAPPDFRGIVNEKAFLEAVRRFPMSKNIEDRRGQAPATPARGLGDILRSALGL